MYLHIGNQKNIREKDIIGIFDADRTTISRITRRYLSEAQKRDQVAAANSDIPKSFVLYYDRKSGGCRVYFSQLSTQALFGRMRAGFIGNAGGTDTKPPAPEEKARESSNRV